MVGCKLCCPGIIDGHASRARNNSADNQDWFFDTAQRFKLRLTHCNRNGEHTINALAQQKVREDAVAVRAATTQVIDSQVIAVSGKRGVDCFKHRREIPAVNVWQHDANVAIATGGQCVSA